MKHILNKENFAAGGIYFVLFLLLFTLVNVDASAQQKKKKKNTSWSASFKLGTAYDNNILKYSDKYLDRFMNKEDEGRFVIETYDDAIINTSLKLSSTVNIFKKKKSVFSINALRKTYVKNSVKNWSLYSFGYRQYFTKKLSFNISYSYIPEFYVRHFRDKQWIDVYGYEPIAFTPYAFSKDNYGFWAQNTFFKNTRVKLSINYMPYYHNKHYTEYDSKNWQYGFQLYQPLHKKFRIDLGYFFGTSDAKGYDAATKTENDNDGPDATYVEDKFTIGFYWSLPKIKSKRHSLDAKVMIFNRYFSSEHPVEVDLLHAGRIDRNLRVYANYRFKLNSSWQFTAFYNWLGRDSYSSSEVNNEYVSDEKDYRQDIIGLDVVYTFKFKL